MTAIFLLIINKFLARYCRWMQWALFGMPINKLPDLTIVCFSGKMKMVTINYKLKWGGLMPENRTKPEEKSGPAKKSGYRMTVGREAILNVLSQSSEHLSAEDIYLKVHAEKPSIGLTTVYRTLELLVSIGLVAKFDFGDGRARFELLQGPKCVKYHHHLVCTGCSRIIEYSDFIMEELEILEAIQAKLSKRYGFSIANHLVQYCGLCSKCIEGKRGAIQAAE
jgi:Fur family transcriptional regulator, ferric uptake regulator